MIFPYVCGTLLIKEPCIKDQDMKFVYHKSFRSGLFQEKHNENVSAYSQTF